MPLTTQEREAIKREVFNEMDMLIHWEVFRSAYGGENIGHLAASAYFLSKPMAFQRQLLIMVAERQVFATTVNGEDVCYQERCRDTSRRPTAWGTEPLSGEQLLEGLRENTISQAPVLYRCIFYGIFRTGWARNWAHWISMTSGHINPYQTSMGLFNYEKTVRWNGWIHDWSQLHDYVVGTRSGETINYGLLPKLWVDVIDALEPTGTAERTIQSRTPPPVYIFSLDTLPELDKNTFVMIDLLGETPPATLQNLLASKVKSRGKATVFNALYSEAERHKVERKRILVNATVETHKWDNKAYKWISDGTATTGREIVYETKNYLTLSEAMTILNNL